MLSNYITFESLAGVPAHKLGLLPFGDLLDAETGRYIRPATPAELVKASSAPRGIIRVGGRLCRVD